MSFVATRALAAKLEDEHIWPQAIVNLEAVIFVIVVANCRMPRRDMDSLIVEVENPDTEAVDKESVGCEGTRAKSTVF